MVAERPNGSDFDVVAGATGREEGLGAVVRTEGAVDGGDVGLDGALGKIELEADALDGRALGEKHQDVPLAVGELGRVVGELRKRAGGFGEEAFALALGEELGGDEDASLEHELDGVREHVGVERLGHEARRAELQDAHDAAAVGESGQDENLEGGLAADDFLHQFRALDAGKRQVENEEVCGFAFARDEFEGAGHVPGRQYFGRRIPVEQHHGKGAPHERVVVDNQVLHAMALRASGAVLLFQRP